MPSSTVISTVSLLFSNCFPVGFWLILGALRLVMAHLSTHISLDSAFVCPFLTYSCWILPLPSLLYPVLEQPLVNLCPNLLHLVHLPLYLQNAANAWLVFNCSMVWYLSHASLRFNSLHMSWIIRGFVAFPKHSSTCSLEPNTLQVGCSGCNKW